MAPKYLLVEPNGESRWLNAEEVIEVDIPDVKIPMEVEMPYKWKPTFHGSLKKQEIPKESIISIPSTLFEKAKAELEAYSTPINKFLEENSVKAETVVQTATSKTKTKAKKSVAKTPKKKDAPAIFQWTFESSQSVGGQKAVYSTLLRSNGDMTCNCPGWRFKKGDERICKHTKQVADEGKKLLKDFKAGKELPAMELVGAGNIVSTANPKKEGDLKYGRRIILD